MINMGSIGRCRTNRTNIVVYQTDDPCVSLCLGKGNGSSRDLTSVLVASPILDSWATYLPEYHGKGIDIARFC